MIESFILLVSKKIFEHAVERKRNSIRLDKLSVLFGSDQLNAGLSKWNVNREYHITGTFTKKKTSCYSVPVSQKVKSGQEDGTQCKAQRHLSTIFLHMMNGPYAGI